MRCRLPNTESMKPELSSSVISRSDLGIKSHKLETGKIHRSIARLRLCRNVVEQRGAKPIQSLNGTQVKGRSLTVNEAKPMAKRDNFGGGRGSDRDRGPNR